jgi:two-component system NtrC family sensor kinase
MAGMGIMAAGIAHELNNPLSIILGKAEMILEEEIPTSVRKYAEDTIKYSKKASEIVKSVMFYSRSASAPGAQWQATHLNDQLKEVIKISKLSPDFDNVEVVTDYQDIPPIRSNTGEIQQVFTNLMMNAAQAMKGKGLLYVKSQYEEGSVVVTLRDTGPGIKKEHLNKLFTPFFTTKDPGKGTGLGLSILHKIITNHGGSISVESEEGKGATFIVSFPKALESAERR